MYHEDVDLSLRLRLAGGRVGVEPAAVVDHDYEFAKGPEKWRCSSATAGRRSCAAIRAGCCSCSRRRCWPPSSALLLVAAAGGWLPQKLARDG